MKLEERIQKSLSENMQFSFDGEDQETFISEITDIIESEYYPKEFVIWLNWEQIKFFPANSQDEMYAECDSNYEEIAWYTTDEVYKYWIENIK
jgi:hypothetical protein